MSVSKVGKWYIHKYYGGELEIVDRTDRNQCFDIVNTDYIRESIIIKIEDGTIKKNTTKGRPTVNSDIFNFFLQRKQMDKPTGSVSLVDTIF